MQVFTSRIECARALQNSPHRTLPAFALPHCDIPAITIATTLRCMQQQATAACVCLRPGLPLLAADLGDDRRKEKRRRGNVTRYDPTSSRRIDIHGHDEGKVTVKNADHRCQKKQLQNLVKN